jgi:hypothetical protein
VRTRVDGVKRQAFVRQIRHQSPDRLVTQGTM